MKFKWEKSGVIIDLSLFDFHVKHCILLLDLYNDGYKDCYDYGITLTILKLNFRLSIRKF